MDLGYGDAYIPCESPPESLTVKETLTISVNPPSGCQSASELIN